MQWYVRANKETTGPVDDATLAAWAREGKIEPDTKIAAEGSSQWVPFEQSPFAMLSAQRAAGGSEAIGTIMLLVPFSAALLIIFWVGEMNMFQKPGDTLAVLALGTVVGTAILAAVEASSLGMGTALDSRGKKGTGPVSWFLALCLFWVLGFPYYLHQRKHYGRRSLVVGAVFIGLFFIGSAAVMNNAIESKRSQILHALGQGG
ncbi:MAG: DUF4339 domain-containing protein [Polyangiaceae bacterium]